MTKIYLKQIEQSEFKFEYLDQDSVKEVYRTRFLDWYEQHVTVMNVLELPMDPNSGEGTYPAYDLLRIISIPASQVSTGVRTSATYPFTFKLSPNGQPITGNLDGIDIQNYGALIQRLRDKFPGVSFRYNPINHIPGQNHSITVSSSTVATQQLINIDSNNNSQSGVISSPSYIEIVKFGYETETPLVAVHETTNGEQAVHPKIKLSPILPRHILVPEQQGAFVVLRRGNNNITINNADVDTIEDAVDRINESPHNVYSAFYQTTSNIIPTAVDGATSAYTNEPSIVFALLVMSPLPDRVEGLTDEEFTKQQYQDAQAESTFFIAGSKTKIEFVDYLIGKAIGTQFSVTKSPSVTNGVSLYDVLQTTPLSLDNDRDTWIPTAITTKTDKKTGASLIDMIREIISDVKNPFVDIGITIKEAGVDAGTVLDKLLVDAANGVSSAITTVSELTTKATEFAGGVFSTITEAVADISKKALGAVVDAFQKVAAIAIDAFTNPPSINKQLAVAAGKIDNTSIADFYPDAVQQSDDNASPGDVAKNTEITEATPEQENKTRPIAPPDQTPTSNFDGGLFEN